MSKEPLLTRSACICTQTTFCFFPTDFTCAAHTLNLFTQTTFCLFPRISRALLTRSTYSPKQPSASSPRFHVRCSHVQPVHFQRRDSSMSNVRVALGSGVGINKDIRHIVTDIPTYIIVANGKIKTSLGERRWTGTISTTLKSTRILSTGFELELSLQPERTAKPLCIPNTVHFMPKPGCCSVLNLNRYKFRC